MIHLVDTHCHIQEAANSAAGTVQSMWAKAEVTAEQMIQAAAEAGVKRLVCVGTDPADSRLAVAFAGERQNVWASVGIHPHEAKDYVGDSDLGGLTTLAGRPKVVAVGECGLDYFYNHSSKADQAAILRRQIELAAAHQLPLIFHVREAFADFWPIFDQYQGLRGVLHSFSATTRELEAGLARGLYIGLNGIMTFTKDEAQLAAARAVPLASLLLETDAPFLTPTPYRGTINEPKYVRRIAEFLSELRGESLEALATATSHNATRLFGLS